jgi:FAD:protein FMN transferase
VKPALIKQAESAGETKSPLRGKIRLSVILPLILVSAFFLYLYFQGRPAGNLFQYFRVTMDTSVELQLSAGSKKEAEELKDLVYGEMERLELLFSRSIAGSDVSRINRAAGSEPVKVSEEVFHVTGRALYYAGISGGAFDPTIAPVIDLWGFLGQEYMVPDRGELEDILPYVDFSLLDLGPEDQTIYLPLPEMSIELGGIAKGFIIDQAVQVLINSGVRYAFINAGGDIALIGTRPDGSPWQIGVRHPREANKIIAVIPVVGAAVVTSGDYERSFTRDGVSYHHIIDPETGMPARSLVSVTIIAESAMEADALSTTVFILGPVEGMDLIEQLPGVEGILITPEMEILVSGGLLESVELHP